VEKLRISVEKLYSFQLRRSKFDQSAFDSALGKLLAAPAGLKSKISRPEMGSS
jgi:hypothetical protein